MRLIDAITVLKVRNKTYVLFYAGLKRGQTNYDAMSPDGSQICKSVSYDEAVEACQLHYVHSTPPSGRKDRIVTKHVRFDKKKLEGGNAIQVDKTNLKDYAEWSFENEENFNLNQYSKRFL